MVMRLIQNVIPKSMIRFSEGKLGVMAKRARERRIRLRKGTADWKDLRNYSKVAKYANDHDEYEAFIRNYDKNITFDGITSAEFIGDGRGLASLNSYRRVVFKNGQNNVSYFEKVYLRSSVEYIKMSWFYQEVYPQIKNRLLIPGKMAEYGDKIAVVYFEWIEDIRPIHEREMIKKFKDLKNIFREVEISSASLENEYITNVELDSNFGPIYPKAEHWLYRHEGATAVSHLRAIKQFVIHSNRVERSFAHGDINKNNFFDWGVIDFDYCGYFPNGFEEALLMTRMGFRVKPSNIDAVLEEHGYHEMTREEKISLLFFCFVNLNRKRAKASYDELKKLWDLLSSFTLPA